MIDNCERSMKDQLRTKLRGYCYGKLLLNGEYYPQCKKCPFHKTFYESISISGAGIIYAPYIPLMVIKNNDITIIKNDDIV